jgi:hypothetical protein
LYYNTVARERSIDILDLGSCTKPILICLSLNLNIDSRMNLSVIHIKSGGRVYLTHERICHEMAISTGLVET